MQTTSHLLMIRPVQFEFNKQTAVNNAFQVPSDVPDIAENARKEFDAFANLLLAHGINVTIIDDTPEPHTPDSIFPNNWISFHGNGTILLYPMFAENRRSERKPHVVNQIRDQFDIKNQIDLSYFERDQIYLEGTGSMVLDRDARIAYACLSPRTHIDALDAFCRKMNYLPVVFTSVDANGQLVYHTNVMMCIADSYVVICLDSIKDLTEKKLVENAIQMTGKSIIPISLEQMNHFAGNMLQVQNDNGEKFLVMSTQAYESLTAKQIKKLESLNDILHSPLDTIETNGGGSARCMLAEIHLKRK